jgi:hypothetical protein
MRTNRFLYAVIGGLLVLTLILGYTVYRDRHRNGVSVDIGPSGISVERR